MNERDGIFKLSTGAELFCREWLPAGDGPAVLLLHGVESHCGWFDDTARALTAGGARVFAFDRSGWGRSDGARGHLASYADALLAVAEFASAVRARCGSCHLAGLSWGGLLALYAAMRRAPLFDSLTLIAPGIVSRTDLGLADKLRVAAGALGGAGERPVPLRLRPEHFSKDAARQAFIAADPHRVRSVTAAFCLETLKMRRFAAEHAARRPLPRSRLLLAGDDAIIDNAATAALLEKCGAEVSVFSGAAHSLVLEEPARVAQEILELAARPEPVRQTAVAVMGAGAVGSVTGALLARGGHHVTLVAREAHATAVNAAGLRLEVPGGAVAVRDNLRAVTRPADAGRTFDVVLLTVKGFDTSGALEEMAPLIGEHTAIVSLQNGLANEEAIRLRYPDNALLPGAICAYLEFLAPGSARWGDDRGGVALAAADACAESAARSLRALGMELRVVAGADAAARIKWSKLMLNLQFNALNAVTGLSAGEILAHPEYGPLAAGALREGFRVMRARGVRPVNLPGYPVAALSRLAALPAGLLRRVLAFGLGKEKGGVSSMRQDLLRGRVGTEIDEINGAVSRLGAAGGIATTANDNLCSLMRAAAESARRAGGA